MCRCKLSFGIIPFPRFKFDFICIQQRVRNRRQPCVSFLLVTATQVFTAALSMRNSLMLNEWDVGVFGETHEDMGWPWMDTRCPEKLLKSLPLLCWKGERKYNERFVRLDKDRDRSLTNYFTDLGVWRAVGFTYSHSSLSAIAPVQ